MSERSVIKISQVRQKLSRRKLLAMVLGAVVVLGVGVGAWMWKPWIAQEPAMTAPGMDSAEYREYVASYAKARENYTVKVISIDQEAKILKVYNETTKSEASYSYTSDTPFIKGVESVKMSPSEISTDDVLYIVHNVENDTMESVWRP